MWRSPGASCAANRATDVCFPAEATLQAAFAPFGTIQNIKLIKEKGVSRSGGQLAACWLAGSTMWPRFARAVAQQGSCLAVDGRSVLPVASRVPLRRLVAPTTTGRDPLLAPSLQQGDKWQVPAQARWRLAMNAERFYHTTRPL